MRQPQTFRSKKDFVYESLRESILMGEMTPGARLIIDDLSHDLGVSAIPVREALQLLQSDGLVTIEPYVGAKVTDLHQGLISEVFTLLDSLEVVSSRAACLKMSQRDFVEMEELLERMDKNLDDAEQWSQDNVQLHLFICDRAGMSLTQELFRRVVDHWNRLRRYYLKDVFAHRIYDAQKQHWQLLAALRTRNPNHVTEVIRDHNQSALRAYQAYLEQKPA